MGTKIKNIILLQGVVVIYTLSGICQKTRRQTEPILLNF